MKSWRRKSSRQLHGLNFIKIIYMLGWSRIGIGIGKFHVTVTEEPQQHVEGGGALVHAENKKEFNSFMVLNS